MRKIVFAGTVLFALCGVCGWKADGWVSQGTCAGAIATARTELAR